MERTCKVGGRVGRRGRAFGSGQGQLAWESGYLVLCVVRDLRAGLP
jgi:hypothetical protein